jgi:tetratricopeptide (TPR) repeat protein
MRHCPVCRTTIREQADSVNASRSPEAKPGGFFNRLFGSTPTTALAWYERALVCEKKADHDGALEALNQAIKLDSRYADAFYVRGLVCTVKAKFEQAIADFKAVRRLKPTSIDNLAVDFAKNPVKVLRAGARIEGLPESMLEILVNNDLSRVYVKRGVALYDRGNHSESIANFNEAIKLHATLNSLHERGRAYHNVGEFKKAIEDLERAAADDPSDPLLRVDRLLRNGPPDAFLRAGILYFLGDSYRQTGELDKAIASLTKSIEIMPETISYVTRADAHLAKGNCDRAIDDYTEAIRQNPEDPQIHFSRGTAYNAKGANAKAIADFNEAIRLEPRFGPAYAERAESYRATGNKAAADQDDKRARELALKPPTSTEAFECLKRGVQLLENGAIDEAMVQFNESIRLEPDNPLLYLQRGVALDSKGKPAKAIADFTEAIRLDPKNAVAYSNRGNTYSNTGRYEQAIADYTEAIRLDPNNPKRYARRARTYRSAGDQAKAAADERRAKALTAS